MSTAEPQRLWGSGNWGAEVRDSKGHAGGAASRTLRSPGGRDAASARGPAFSVDLAATWQVPKLKPFLRRAFESSLPSMSSACLKL